MSYLTDRHHSASSDVAWQWAKDLSKVMLKPTGTRWLHVNGVGGRAQAVAHVLPVHERGVLISAAYLHDIGYAPCLGRTGSHQIDGACFVRSIGQPRLANLIAHHSAARFEVQLRGLREELAAFHDERSVLSAALTYCDFTTGPAGDAMSLTERFADIATRYRDGGLVPIALERARPHILKAVERFQSILEAQTTSTDIGLLAPFQVMSNP